MKWGAFLLPLAALAASAATAQAVETGTADWDKLPRARVASGVDYQSLANLAEQVVESKACRDAGWRPERFNIDEPYAVLLEPDGSVKRIVIRETACPGIDYVVGLMLQALSQKHKFHATGDARPRWYGGRIAFAVSPQSQ
jgi:hypothetical protein